MVSAYQAHQESLQALGKDVAQAVTDLEAEMLEKRTAMIEHGFLSPVDADLAPETPGLSK